MATISETTTIQWLRDVDEAFAQAKAKGKPVLIDFTAAPM